jgi:hypothetical protein
VLPPALRTVGVAGTDQLRAALSDARPGDEIVLAPGTYAGGLAVARSGTAEHPIVIRGGIDPAQKTKPVDQRTGLPVINGSGYNPVVTVTGSYVVLDSLRLENTSLIGIQLEAAKYCVIEGCQVTGRSSGYNQYIYIHGGGAGGGRHLVQDNHLADSGAASGYGILQHGHAGPGTVIRRNIITGFHDGINPSGDELELTDAILPETHPDVLGTWSNHSTDVYENVIHTSSDDDIEVDGIAVNERIFRNYLSTGAGDSCTNAISIAPVAPGPFFFVRNIVTNFHEGGIKYNTASNRGTIRNCFFYHNTVKNDEGVERRGMLLTMWEGDGDAGSPSKNTVYKNNIFAGDKMLIQRLVTVHTPQYDPNLWYTKQTSGTMFQWGKNGPYYTSFADWQKGTGEEAHGLYAAPLVGADFRLAAQSPAIDKGVRIPGINDSYAGGAPDMGAYEFGTPGTAGPGTTTPDAAICAISGSIRDDAGQPLAGVLVTLSGGGAASTLTDAAGRYRFASLKAGTYTVSAARTGYVFSPAHRVLPLSSQQDGLDFTARPATLAATLANAVAYPNPWKAGDIYSPVIRFKNLTEGTRIRIYALDGMPVKEINEPDKAEVQWDVAGENIASGVYLCVLSNDRGETKKQKLAVIR